RHALVVLDPASRLDLEFASGSLDVDVPGVPEDQLALAVEEGEAVIHGVDRLVEPAADRVETSLRLAFPDLGGAQLRHVLDGVDEADGTVGLVSGNVCLGRDPANFAVGAHDPTIERGLGAPVPA